MILEQDDEDRDEATEGQRIVGDADEHHHEHHRRRRDRRADRTEDELLHAQSDERRDLLDRVCAREQRASDIATAVPMNPQIGVAIPTEIAIAKKSKTWTRTSTPGRPTDLKISLATEISVAPSATPHSAASA